nr:MAG TPA: DNA adenine methylase [Caudoviricetes sp.]
MKPCFKYSGGKTKELKNILPLPEFTGYFIEPFAGGAAVAFALERPSILTDIRDNVIVFYEQLRDNPDEILDTIELWKTMDINEREKLYYTLRDDFYGTSDKMMQALRWLFIRQQVFSGMDRVNSSGKMNAAFGWYKNFTTNTSMAHSDFLKKCVIKKQSFVDTISQASEDDFIFLDPPYLERNSDYGNDNDDGRSEKLHRELADALKTTKAKWLLIHSDCELYRELYKDYSIKLNGHCYSQNFKGRDNSNSKVQHLYISNY